MRYTSKIIVNVIVIVTLTIIIIIIIIILIATCINVPLRLETWREEMRRTRERKRPTMELKMLFDESFNGEMDVDDDQDNDDAADDDDEEDGEDDDYL